MCLVLISQVLFLDLVAYTLFYIYCHSHNDTLRRPSLGSIKVYLKNY